MDNKGTKKVITPVLMLRVYTRFNRLGFNHWN